MLTYIRPPLVMATLLPRVGTINPVADTSRWLPSEEAREPLRRTFDSTAERYDAARPAYPEELFDDLVDLTGLQPGARLLEVGCGTGKATLPLLRRGFSV